MELYDIETGTARKVTVTERNLRQYRALFDGFQEEVRAYCARYAVGHSRAATDVPFDDLVLRMMRQAGAVR